MNKRIKTLFLLASIMVVPGMAVADDVSIKDGDTVEAVLTSYIGQRVTVYTKSGQEMSGKVTTVTDRLTHLSELTGKEYYDAVVVNKTINAVIIRTK